MPVYVEMPEEEEEVVNFNEMNYAHGGYQWSPSAASSSESSESEEAAYQPSAVVWGKGLYETRASKKKQKDCDISNLF